MAGLGGEEQLAGVAEDGEPTRAGGREEVCLRGGGGGGERDAG